MGFFCKEKKKPDRRVAVVIATVQPCFSPVPRFFLFVFLSHGNRKGKKKYHPFLHLCLVLFHKQIQYFVQLRNLWGTKRIIRWSVQHVTPIALMYNNAAHYAANTHAVLQSR